MIDEEFSLQEAQTFEELAESMRELELLKDSGILHETFKMKKEHIKLRARNRMALIYAKAAADPLWTRYRELIMKARPMKQELLKKYGAIKLL